MLASCLRASLLVMIAATLPGQASTDASIGVWPWLVGNIDAYQDEIINRSKSTGLDTIYISLWRTTGRLAGDLTIVDEAKTWSTGDGRLLPRVTLSTFIKKAHAQRIQVVGVVKVFNTNVLPNDYRHQDHITQKVIRYLVHSYDASGRAIYPLDGIALDYIRWFGGNHTSREVNRFLDETRKVVGALPIHAYVISSPWSLDGSPYNNSFRTYSAFRNLLITNYGQDWEQMAARIDCLMPMTYVAEGTIYGKNLAYMEGYTKKAASYARIAVNAAKSGCRVVLAVRTWNGTGQTTTQKTVEASCRGAMRGGANGFMAFRYFTARGHPGWFQGLANHAVAGQDLPIADVTAAVSGATADLDTSGCRHQKTGPSGLFVQHDVDGDGRFASAMIRPGRSSHLLRTTASRLVTVRVLDTRGNRAVARMKLSPPAYFTAAPSVVSAANGGTVAMQIAAGAAQAGQIYVVLTSFSGSSPGTPMGAFTVPINVDPFTTAVYGTGNNAVFQGFLGKFDSLGAARPKLAVPNGAIPSVLVGRVMTVAAVAFGPRSGQPLFAPNALPIAIVR